MLQGQRGISGQPVGSQLIPGCTHDLEDFVEDCREGGKGCIEARAHALVLRPLPGHQQSGRQFFRDCRAASGTM